MNDYIKRSLVKAQFTGTFNDEYPVSLCKTLIDEVPSVDVEEVKHGKWEKAKCQPTSKNFICSACHGLVSMAYESTYGYYKYCPNCGAKMDLKEREI